MSCYQDKVICSWMCYMCIGKALYPLLSYDCIVNFHRTVGTQGRPTVVHFYRTSPMTTCFRLSVGN